VDAIHLSGLGEPTMHPRFYDMLAQLEPFFAVTIYSNGTFPIERCRDILRANRIIINLGASDPGGYRTLCGRDSFMKVIKNIRELATLKRRLNPDFSIEVVIVVTDLNETDQAMTERVARKLGADRVVKKAAYLGERPYTRQERKAAIKGDWPPCFDGWFLSAINLNGDVNVCCFLEALTIGNVFTKSFKDIWGSEGYSHARRAALQGDLFRNYQECMNCPSRVANEKHAGQMETYRVLRERIHGGRAGA
jgi:MoaA/NifB/PqqE/SkfB family radical SAM enzyme